MTSDIEVPAAPPSVDDADTEIDGRGFDWRTYYASGDGVADGPTGISGHWVQAAGHALQVLPKLPGGMAHVDIRVRRRVTRAIGDWGDIEYDRGRLVATAVRKSDGTIVWSYPPS